jgi:Ca2+-binding EF-hand superfamily protein
MKTNLSRFVRCLVALSPIACLAALSPLAFAESPSAGNEELFKRLDANANGTIAADEVPSDQKRLFIRLVSKADVDRDKSLSRDEFLAALVPTRPEKEIEAKQPVGYPQADAVRYLLLTMDTSRNSWIEPDEVPKNMQRLYDVLAERIDANKNGTMDRYELSRGARELNQVAARYVSQERINVEKELKRFDKSQGDMAKRFDETPGPFLSNLKNPKQARQVFTQFDTNKDGKLELGEFPEPMQQQIKRFIQVADRDRDGGLSEREFLAGAERINRFMSSQRPKAEKRDERHKAESMPAEAMPAEAMPAEE